MDELAILWNEMYRRAQALTEKEFDQQVKKYMLEDIHRLRGRFMQGASNQKWQIRQGVVNIQVNDK